jgi:hypothetical protein
VPRRSLLFFALVLAALVPSRLVAQNIDALLHGVVKDQTGAVLPGVVVSAINIDTGLTRVVTSDDAGRYSLPPVPAGTYDLRAEVTGFQPVIRRQQPLHVGTTITLDFILDLIAVTSVVDVVVAAPMMETTRNALTRLVTREEIDALPVVGRNFNDLAALAPGVTATGLYGGVDISGSRDFQNAYNVDGVSSEGLGLGEQRLSYAQDWIEEFQVLTSQYNVEFGGASGGVVNAITRSGSAQLKGRAYSFIRNDAWDAKPVFATPTTALDITRGGATVGGKLFVDRLFFFGGVEGFRNRSTSIVNSAFAGANGSVPYSRDQALYMAKVEHHARDASTVTFRANGMKDRADGDGVGGINTEEHGRSTTYDAHEVIGGWSRVIAGALFNELRVAFNITDFESACTLAVRSPLGARFERAYPGGVFGCPTAYGQRTLGEIQVIDNIAWVRGRHRVKAGVQLSRGSSSGDFRSLRDGVYRFPSDIPFDLANPASYPIIFTIFEGPTAWDYAWSAGGAFVQDSWQVRDDFTINIGIRYDLDGTYTALNPVARVERGLNAVRLDANNVAPRAGIAWTPFDNDRRTLVRGGAGVYYDQNHERVANLLVTNGILAERSVQVNANVPGLNPFAPDSARARRFLAEALARNAIPDLSMLPPGAAPDVDTDLQIPYAIQASGGVAHDFGRGLTASGDVVYSRGLDQYVVRDVNYDRAAAAAGRVLRPNPNYSSINRYGNGGTFLYRALQVQARWARGSSYLVNLSYTLAKNDSNTATALLGGVAGGAGATNPFDYDEDNGPADNDVRHVATANGVTRLPFGMQLAAMFSARSALPFSATSNAQLDQDPFVDRPEPRNARRGDMYLSLDIRLSKSMRFGGRRALTAFVELFNATNATNLTGHLGVFGAARFGQPTTALEKRRTQLGVRFDY